MLVITIKTIFNVPVTEVILTFFKNKPCSIQVLFGDVGEDNEFTITQYQNILSILEKATENNGTNLLTAVCNNERAIWDGTKAWFRAI